MRRDISCQSRSRDDLSSPQNVLGEPAKVALDRAKAVSLSLIRKDVTALLLKRSTERNGDQSTSDASPLHLYPKHAQSVLRHYNNFLSAHQSFPISDLIVSGILESNIYSPDDYVSGRKLPEYEERLACDFSGVHEVIKERVGSRDLIGMEIGSGDGLSLDELRQLYPEWGYFGIGDRLFFSLEKLLYQFLKPGLSPAEETFAQLFFVFVRREFRKRFQRHLGMELREKRVIDLNELYEILRQAQMWLRDHLDVKTSTYFVSEEFEYDEKRRVPAEVMNFFEKLLNANDVVDFYSRFFSEDFFRSLSTEGDILNLNQHARFSSKGFVCLRFQDIDRLLNCSVRLRRQMSFLFGCRSDSHLSDEEYAVFLERLFEFLGPGGIYISDGHKRSYNRKLRFQAIRYALDKHEGLRPLVIVEKTTGVPKSIFVERGVQTKDGYEYYSPDQLRRMFKRNDVVFQSLEDAESQFFDLNQLIQDILVENGDNLEAFRGVNDLLYRVHEYMRRGLDPFDLIKEDHGRNSLIHAIVSDLQDIQLEQSFSLDGGC